jgi:electron transport complex protein RnfG
MTERGKNTILKSAAALGLVAVIGSALLTVVYHLTADRIAAQERQAVQRQLSRILPPGRYDNELQDDRIFFRDEAHFPNGQTVTAYRARAAGNPVALIFRFTAVDGYNGDIQLLTGIYGDGTLAGVRVISHKETPGLGDSIEEEKSGWVLDFEGKSLKQPGRAGWAVRRDGGEFDQFTGATITPRAIVEAVHSALEYFDQYRAELFKTPSGTGMLEREDGSP